MLRLLLSSLRTRKERLANALSPVHRQEWSCDLSLCVRLSVTFRFRRLFFNPILRMRAQRNARTRVGIGIHSSSAQCVREIGRGGRARRGYLASSSIPMCRAPFLCRPPPYLVDIEVKHVHNSHTRSLGLQFLEVAHRPARVPRLVVAHAHLRYWVAVEGAAQRCSHALGQTTRGNRRLMFALNWSEVTSSPALSSMM